MLHLTAADEADLQIISAQMQDALLRREDLRFDAKRRRFVLMANRFVWHALPAKQRCRVALRFDDVSRVQAQGLAAAKEDTILSLLALRAEMANNSIILEFSGHIAIRLQVDCINTALDDLGSAWQAESVPNHGA